MSEMDLDILEKAILLLQQYQLTEISYETKHSAFRIKKENSAITVTPSYASSSISDNGLTNPISKPETPKAAPLATLTVVKASLVGTFYRATDPNSAPLCVSGQLIKKGDPLGLIEAMKVLTIVASPCSGSVVDICIDNAQVVEYDQILFRISPSGMP
jgi:acetyl-CoA carboxylase biotin carboxyl carrier protein